MAELLALPEKEKSKKRKTPPELVDYMNQELGLSDAPDRRITVDRERRAFLVPYTYADEHGEHHGVNVIPWGETLALNKADPADMIDILRAVHYYPRLDTKEALSRWRLDQKRKT